MADFTVSGFDHVAVDFLSAAQVTICGRRLAGCLLGFAGGYRNTRSRRFWGNEAQWRVFRAPRIRSSPILRIPVVTAVFSFVPARNWFVSVDFGAARYLMSGKSYVEPPGVPVSRTERVRRDEYQRAS